MWPKLQAEIKVLIICYLVLTVLFGYCSSIYVTSQDGPFLLPIVLLFLGMISLPMFGLMLYRQIQKSIHQASVIAAQKNQLQNQKAGISALRHQRHDILNDITLASSYIQLGKIEHAQKCLDFVAANMSDRYNFNSLPNLAWETLIEHKTEQAKKSGIALKVDIQAPPPGNEHEQRLLPKLINNLADNAFEAAIKGEKPSVSIEWIAEQNARVLRVKNNGATIRKEDVDKIFLPGFTSHPGLGRGWGLAICLKIADELGGTITVTISERWTEFTFRLPTVSTSINKPA